MSSHTVGSLIVEVVSAMSFPCRFVVLEYVFAADEEVGRLKNVFQAEVSRHFGSGDWLIDRM